MNGEKEELRAFDPRSPEHRGRLWVRVVTPDRAFLHFFWGRLAAIASVAMLVGWLALAGGIWGFLKYKRDWQEVSFADVMLLPLRYKEFRGALAGHYIAKGEEEVVAKNYRYAYTLFMSGLSRAPGNLKARRTVASIMVRYGLLPRALDTLAEGVKYHPDLEYLKLMFGWMLEAGQDERALTLARGLLPGKPDANLTHQFVALQAATAHFDLGRYDAAEALIQEWRLFDSLEGEILLARCDWERGFRVRALNRLEREVARFSQRGELYLQLIRFHRELGNYEPARRYALLRQFNDPASPGPRIDLLHGYNATGDRSAEKREAAAFLVNFREDPMALRLLADYAVDTVEPALMEQISHIAENNKFPMEPVYLARARLALSSQDYRSALVFCDQALKEYGEPVGESGSMAEPLRIVALLGLGQPTAAATALGSFLGHARLRASDAVLLARELRLVGGFAEARRVLEQACKIDTFNQAAVSEIVLLDALQRNRSGLAVYLPRLLTMRKPARAVLEEALLALDETKDGPLLTGIREALSRLPARAIAPTLERRA